LTIRRHTPAIVAPPAGSSPALAGHYFRPIAGLARGVVGSMGVGVRHVARDRRSLAQETNATTKAEYHRATQAHGEAEPTEGTTDTDN
jgi:hypothetical protein